MQSEKIVWLEKCAVGEKICSWKNVQSEKIMWSENKCPVGEKCVVGKNVQLKNNCVVVK